VVARDARNIFGRSLPPLLLKQEALGEYLSMSGGRVYYAFDRAKHVGDAEVDASKPLLWALDFNVDPMSSVVAQVEGQRVAVLDEIVLRRATTQLARAVSSASGYSCRSKRPPATRFMARTSSGTANSRFASSSPNRASFEGAEMSCRARETYLGSGAGVRCAGATLTNNKATSVRVRTGLRFYPALYER